MPEWQRPPVARARRTVLVVYAGLRRNRFANHSRGFLSQDGADPAEIAKRSREQLSRYETLTWCDGMAECDKGRRDAFKVMLADGRAMEARGVEIEEEPIASLEGEADLRTTDGRLLSFAGLFTMSRNRPATPIAEALGCELEDAVRVAGGCCPDDTPSTVSRGAEKIADRSLPPMSCYHITVSSLRSSMRWAGLTADKQPPATSAILSGMNQ